MLSIRYPMELGLVGDAKATLAELLPLLRRSGDTSWRRQIEEEVREWWRLIEERALQDADPINPQRLFWELNRFRRTTRSCRPTRARRPTGSPGT